MASTVDPSAVLAQLTASFMKLPLSQKIIFPLLIVACVVGITYVSRWATEPEFVTLYQDMSPADGAAVIERLKEQKVRYKIKDDGGTIQISPPEMLHELRISLASEGLPKGGKIGYEIFDTQDLG
ncbi:MAG: hypothetical protein KDD53_03650, partial [Bdellovibrionales bacterium]|nr:hypothetical protein [Bdellovibrionales bacterium]